MQPYGQISLWGFSPSINILECTNSSSPLELLLVGASDLRHLLHTVHEFHHCQQKTDHLHFYILESKLEVVARHLLFLTILTDSQIETAEDKAKLFLQIYGNLKVTEYTNEYLKRKSQQMQRILGYNELGSLQGVLDFSALKMRDRDHLEAICNEWIKQTTELDISKEWDERLRVQFKQRYEFRRNMFDWDYQMTLRSLQGELISLEQYTEWRETGIAYDFNPLENTGDSVVTNHTFITEVAGSRNGVKVTRRGYWSDMIVSPYVNFGIETKNMDLKERNIHGFKKNATDVSLHNLTEYIRSFEESITQKRLKISFLFDDSLHILVRRSAMHNRFSHVYFGALSAHLITPDLITLLQSNTKTSLTVEVAKYFLTLTKDERRKFFDKVVEIVTVQLASDNCTVTQIVPPAADSKGSTTDDDIKLQQSFVRFDLNKIQSGVE